MRINGFEVAMDTADELEAIVGQISPEPVSPSTPRALSPIPQEPSSFAPRPPAVRAARPVTDVASTRTSVPHHKYGKLPDYLKALSPWWDCLSRKMRESVELRAAGENNDTIAKKMGKTPKSVSVMVNVARRRLEAKRDASSLTVGEAQVEGGDEKSDEGDGEDDDEDPEPERVFDAAGISNESGGDGLAAYLRSIRSYRMLTKQEEHDLAVRFVATRNPRLAKRLVQANLRFVVRVALSYSREQGKLVDMIQEGSIGLMRGVEKFDPTRGMRLLTYAQHWIHAYIKMFIMKDKRLVRVGKTQRDRKLFWSLVKTRNRLRADNGGVEPTNEEVAKEMGVSISDLEMAAVRYAPEVGLEKRVGNDDDDERDWLADGKPRADQVVEEGEEVGKLRALIADMRLGMNKRLQHILDARILAEEPVTLERIAETYGISRERVRQLEERLREKIKQRFVSQLKAVA